MRQFGIVLVLAIIFTGAGYVWGFWASTRIHGDWILARTEDGRMCKGMDVKSGRDLGEWLPQVDSDGFARCHPKGGLWENILKGLL